MIFEKIKHFIISLIIYFKGQFNSPKEIHHTEIPIIINNFNRLNYLEKLLKGLEKRGYKNIHILDNQSTYPPLLEFYKKTKHKVHFLDKNYGFRALWKSGMYHKFKNNYFAYTDPDLEIIDECPDDFLEFFRKALQKNKLWVKVGFSLKIDDIPNHNPLKENVLLWEKTFYTKRVKTHFFRAPVDTTFGLYPPYSFKHVRSHQAKIFRSDIPYQMRHLPWYVDPKNLSDEEIFYSETTKKESWLKKISNLDNNQS